MGYGPGPVGGAAQGVAELQGWLPGGLHGHHAQHSDGLGDIC